MEYLNLGCQKYWKPVAFSGGEEIAWWCDFHDDLHQVINRPMVGPDKIEKRQLCLKFQLQ